MRLPLKDKKFIFLLVAILVVVTLEIFSIFGIDMPMPYAPFIYVAFILAIGHKVIWNGFQALFRLNFSRINLLTVIAVV